MNDVVINDAAEADEYDDDTDTDIDGRLLML